MFHRRPRCAYCYRHHLVYLPLYYRRVLFDDSARFLAPAVNAVELPRYFTLAIFLYLCLSTAPHHPPPPTPTELYFPRFIGSSLLALQDQYDLPIQPDERAELLETVAHNTPVGLEESTGKRKELFDTASEEVADDIDWIAHLQRDECAPDCNE